MDCDRCLRTIGRTKVWILTALIAMGFAADVNAQAPLPPGSDPAGTEQQVVEEINAIRQQLGGGIASQLKDAWIGNLPGLPIQQEFDRELKRLVSEAKPAEIAAPGRPNRTANMIDHSNNIANSGDSTRSNVDGLDEIPQGPIRVRPPRGEHLRRAARHLEQAAEELEYAGYFDQADRLRASAGQLWQQARSSNPAKNPIDVAPK